MMAEYRAEFRRAPGSVRAARRAILDYAQLCGFDPEEVGDISLAAGEALANSVEHGNKSLGRISVRCRFMDGELEIEVSDGGPGFDYTRIIGRRREPDALRGFGISIMHAVMDTVQYEARGATVRLRKKLDGANTADADPPLEA